MFDNTLDLSTHLNLFPGKALDPIYDDNDSGNYYINMYGSGHVYPLVGPFSTMAAAVPHIARTRAAAREVDVRAHFFRFDVSERNSDQPGIFNARILGSGADLCSVAL